MKNGTFASTLNMHIKEEELAEGINRPQTLKEFIGQNQIKKNLSIFIQAASKRNESLDHVLLHGPPGLGKTTLANIIAHEMGVGIKTTSGPLLAKPHDIAAILTNLHSGDILFIDEIHRLNISAEEVLYPAMEDNHLDIIIGKGQTAKTLRIDIPKFTLIGATTKLGLLSKPLRDRFGIPISMEYYTPEDLQHVVLRGCKILNMECTPESARTISRRARGTPRIALRLLKRIRDFAQVKDCKCIDNDLVSSVLSELGVDELGLNYTDYKYLKYIVDNYGDNPVGIESIAAALHESANNIEETVEPYLIKNGFVQRTSRGRIVSLKGRSHIQKNSLFGSTNNL